MDKIEKILIVTLLVMVSCITVMTVLSYVPNGTTEDEIIQIKTGERFNVTLSDNSGSTGYEWQVTSVSDSSVVRLAGTEYTLPPQTNPPMVGRPGKVTFTFEALRAGSATVTLQCSRPWEKNAGSIVGTYMVSVVVSP